MKRKLFATILLSLVAWGNALAQNTVKVGSQIMAESDIQEGVNYVLQSQAVNNQGAPQSYIIDTGAYYSIPNAGNSATEAAVYQFVKNTDGTWKIKNVYTGKYWGVPAYNVALAPADEANAGHWTLNFISSGKVCPTAPDANNAVWGIDRSSQRVYGYTADSSKPAQAFKIFTMADGSTLDESDVTVTRGYQTCGRGNANSLMLRIDLSPTLDLSNAKINVSLNAAAQANISSLYIHKTAQTEFIANIPNTPVGTASSIGSTATIDIGSVSAGLNHFWLCATVKDDAELGAILEATLTGITFTSMGETNTLDVPASKTPTRQGMKVFNQQNFVFKPTTDGNRFYRIPAMVLGKNDNIVVAIDRRGENNSDLGNHKIDVSIIRSEDNGRTWGTQEVVAVGNMAIESRYGYGDPVLARTPSGRIICLMACGRNMYFGTGGYSDGTTHYNNWIGMLTSDDNGVTWQGDSNGDPIFITEDVFGGRGQSLFVTSGKGLTTEEGAVMFAVNVKRVGNNTSDCYILKTTDDGNTWTLLPNIAYSGCDESKLEQLNDGQLLLSVRQSGNRGWNTGSADGMTWGEQYRSADISGNACNADLIYYSRTTKGAKRDIMLHSYINTSDRESLQLAMSVDGGESWHDVYNIQPNGSCYSTMQVLSDGSLAILYEDASFSNILSDPFGAGNGFAINFVTITKDQINEWYDELVAPTENIGVIIMEHGKTTNSEAPFVTWQETSNGNWAKKFTTNAATGQAGVVVSTNHYAFNRQTSYDQRVLVMKPSAAGAQNDVYTITAPDGFIIEGYSIGGYFGTGSETYTLTAENGSSVFINKKKSQQNPPDFLEVTDINAKSTTFTMSNNNSTNNSFAVITQFIVYLKEVKKSIVLLDDDRGAEYPNEDRIADNLTAQTIDVTIHGRTLFKDNAWNTLCLPFAVSDFAGTPLEGADVRELNSVSFKNGTLTMNFSEGLDAIEAGKPYIVRWTSGDDIKNPVFTNVQFDNTDGQLVFDNVGLIFKGTFTPFVFEAQDKSKLYMGNENKLLYPKKTMAIKAFRAFFDLGDNLVAAEPSATAGAKEVTNFALNFGGEATGVSSLDRGEQSAEGIYTIDGRKLMGEPTQKGVYIVNGKKVVK